MTFATALEVGAAPRESLVQLIAGDPGLLRELHRAVGAGDIPKRGGNERRILGRLLKAGSKAGGHVSLGLAVLGGIPQMGDAEVAGRLAGHWPQRLTGTE